jgi:hypothetical protein
MQGRLVRTLRTGSSERYLWQRKVDQDSAALELHYLRDGRISGTLIVLDESISDSEVPDVLSYIDEVLLPDASVAAGNVSFTVIRGRVVGAFAPTAS